MPAKLEEVVVDPDPLHPQHLGKQRAQDLLLRRARPPPQRQTASDPAQAAHGGPACRSASAAADPAPPAQTAPCSQAAAPASPQRTAATSSAAPGRRNHVTHQPRLTRTLLARHHRRLRNTRLRRKAQPRSRQARSGTRAASPARPPGPGTPAPRQTASAPRSPLRYIRLPAAPNGSATNRSAVSPNRPR